MTTIEIQTKKLGSRQKIEELFKSKPDEMEELFLILWDKFKKDSNFIKKLISKKDFLKYV